MSPHSFFDLAGIVAVISMLGTFLTVARKVTKRIDRDESLKHDYPPHLHRAGQILYPAEYPPPPMEPLEHGWGK